MYIFRSDNSQAPVQQSPRPRPRRAIDAFADPARCEVGQQVALQRRRSKTARFRTFSRVRSRRGGAFSLKISPTRTYIYRARVGRTVRCLGAVSKGKKVSVSRARRGGSRARRR